VAVRVVGDEYPPWRRRLLHAGRQVHRVAHGRVLHPQVGAHLAHHHQPGVDPHPHGEPPDLLLPLQPDRVLAGTSDDVERRADGALGVILVGDRRAEEGQHGIAHQPRQRPLVAVHRLDEELEGTGHDVHDLFRVQVFGHRRRALDVAEEDGHHPPLVADLAPRRQQPVGKGLGDQPLHGVAEHGLRIPLRCRGRCRQRRGALGAEGKVGRHAEAAIGTAPLQRRSAPGAEVELGWTVKATSWTDQRNLHE
jgi:hypothetical protein